MPAHVFPLLGEGEYHTISHDIARYRTISHDTVRYRTVSCDIVRYRAIPCGIVSIIVTRHVHVIVIVAVHSGRTAVSSKRISTTIALARSPKLLLRFLLTPRSADSVFNEPHP